MHMRTIATLFVAGLLAGGCASTTPATKGTHAMDLDTRQLQDAERTWVRALTDAKPELLAALVDDQFSFIGPDGQFEDREAYLAGYRAAPAQGVVVESIDMDDIKIRITGDTGVVTGRVVAKVKVADQQFVENVRFTRVYQRRGAEWRMIAGQGTRLALDQKPS